MILTLVGLMILLLGGGHACAEDQVERPWKDSGDVIGIVDLSHWGEGYAPWVALGSGEATHLGGYTTYVEGVNNFITGENTGAGYLVAANGDELYMVSTSSEVVLPWNGVLPHNLPINFGMCIKEVLPALEQRWQKTRVQDPPGWTV